MVVGTFQVEVLHQGHQQAGESLSTLASVSSFLKFHPVPILCIHCQMGAEPHLLFPLAQIIALGPLRRGEGPRGSFRIPNDVLKGLQEADYHERYLVVCELLTEANPWTRVER